MDDYDDKIGARIGGCFVVVYLFLTYLLNYISLKTTGLIFWNTHLFHPESAGDKLFMWIVSPMIAPIALLDLLFRNIADGLF